jgi:glutathionylspermidine synthase
MSIDSREFSLPSYGEFARLVYRTAILSDPWLNGVERFRIRGVVLTQRDAERLCDAAERVAFLHHELVSIVRSHPRFLDEFFDLTPYQRSMWLASDGRWHGVARVDLFLCEDGQVRSCEMNSDTPSGEAEAVICNELLHPFHAGTSDPNTQLRERFLEMLIDSYRADCAASGRDPAREPGTVGIIYPTDLPEDLSMIALYKRWLEDSGLKVILGSPFNITVDQSNRVMVLGEKVDVIVRHYKTDWWGEREPIWNGQPDFPDSDPLEEQLLPLLEAHAQRRVTIINPFGSVVTQNKLSMAFMWEKRDLFSERSRSWIEELIPETLRFTSVDPKQLRRQEWVLKSTYGCEGDSVVCGPFVKLREWRAALAAAVPRHWVVQRFFKVARYEGFFPNYGVYVIGGRAGGFYTRLSNAGTDYAAVTSPTFVCEREPAE